MAFHVEILPRARRDLRNIYTYIHAENSRKAHAWFNGLGAAIASLDQHPARGPVIPGNDRLRHLLYGTKPHVYRIIYAIDERRRVVSVVHIRRGARDRLTPASGG
jgi:toxin ParE1/3/4